MKEIKKILIISSDKNLREVLNFCFDGWGYEVYLEESIGGDITLIKKISPNVIVVDVHSANKLQLEICSLLKNDFMTAFIPVITLINKSQLRQQLLNIKQGVDDYLIKPPDPLDLRVRIDMAIKRSQYSFYVSSLTGFPGGRIIEETIKERIKGGLPFTFGYLDIDNFKYFNDVYGYLEGDKVIMQTAYMLYTVVNNFGNKDDFIGHIGGDDFVFISTPDKYKEICQNFIIMFDKLMRFHYSKEDRDQGFIVARDRSRKIQNIPLMSVSVAIVNKTDPQAVKSLIEINERVAEIKRYLKGIPGSKFMVDRRDLKERGSAGPQSYDKEKIKADSHSPLGQILLKKKLISEEQLDEALKIQWKRGVVLGEVIKEMGLVSEKELLEALDEQKREA
ncbi:MAG: diguanylate cyclase [Candidatus Omnitrophica bacterium]|nr:diguanylate cyclase [Candidatus Omnitrophota bacterium]